MLTKLRVKFIALNMTIAALVLIVVFGAICVLYNYSSEDKAIGELENTLSRTEEYLSIRNRPDQNPIENDRPSKQESEDQSALRRNQASDSLTEGEAEPDTETDGIMQVDAEEDQGNVRIFDIIPLIGQHEDDGRSHLPVAVYLMDGNDNVELMPLSTASFSDEALSKVLAEALEANRPNGHLEDDEVHFSIRETKKDGTLIAFVDESSIPSWQNLASILATMGIIAMLVFLLINIFFSRWALKPVESAWNQQQRFIADASHELKTPLTVILANSAILKARPESTIAEQDQWVESTRSEALRMQELVNEMLELARPKEAAPAQNELGDIDVSDLVENLALQFESVAFEKGVSIEYDLKPGIHIKGNEKRLQRLVSTLIDNACKYADKDSVVTVKLEDNNRDAIFSVHNTGQTIPKEDLPHIFDRFYRTDKARSSDTGGFGLGLAIAREVAREHGGDIVADSSPAKGTAFTATLRKQA